MPKTLPTVACILAGFVLLPLIALLLNLGHWDLDTWQHLYQHVLLDYVLNSLGLTLGVGIGSCLLAIPMAWMLTQYHLPGRRVWQWLVLMPLAMPAYIIAYTYTGILDSSGPVQSSIQSVFNVSVGEYWFPNVRSLPGAIIMMSLVLYPYIFVLARSAFSEQSNTLKEAAQSMGYHRWRYFFYVALPLAKPAIVTGAALSMMEALADYGTVQYFGISTFTTGIYRTWFGLGNEQVAAQLSLLLSVVVLVVLLLEQRSRRHLSVATGDNHTHSGLLHLSRSGQFWTLVFLLCVVSAGFFIPVGQMLIWIFQRLNSQEWPEFLSLILDTVTLAVAAMLVIVLVAIIIAYARRLSTHVGLKILAQLSVMGYAFPGTVIAVGAMIALTRADYWLNDTVGLEVGLLLSGSLFALVFAYLVRFLAVAIHNVETGLGRVTNNMDMAAQTMGYSPLQRLQSVHIPLIKGSVLSAMLLVFVDVLKELPATLIMRPFDFNTLAVRAFELASDERLADAALPSLSIVMVGLLPVILLAYHIDKSYQTRRHS